VSAIEFGPAKAALWRLWYGPPGIGEYLGLNLDLRATALEAGYYVLYLIYQFPTLSLLLGLVGAVTLLRRQPPVGLLLLMTIAVNAFIFVRHTVWPSVGNEKYVFYIADYAIFAILCAFGADFVLTRKIVQRRAPRMGRLAPATILVTVALVPPVFY